MEQGTPSSPPVPVGGVQVASMRAGKAAVEGAAAMTSLGAGNSSSTSYLHSSRRRAPLTSSSIPGIVGVAAGVARRGIITAPVTVGAGVACHSNSPTAPAGEDASFILERGVVLMGARAGGSHGALIVEVTWGAFSLPPLARNLSVSSNSRGTLTDR